jgi:hypothetical protein
MVEDLGHPCTADVLVRVLQEIDLALRDDRVEKKAELLGCAAEKRDFLTALWSDAVVAYVSRNSDGGGTPVRTEFAGRLKQLRHDSDRRYQLDFEGRNVGCLALSQKSRNTGELTEKDGLQLNITAKNYHQFMVLDQGMQAGINLQQYHTFIFMQMDLLGTRLLEPVDIEQWIGRIHRTGQVRTARIITVLNTFMQNGERNPEREFLKWYYGILDDAKGLDLYGDTTPDIAFLQPVIVDALRAVLHMKGNYPEMLLEVMAACGTEKGVDPAVLRSAQGKMKLTRNKETVKYSFSELLELYYYMGDNWRTLVRELIRMLCADRRFGKPGAMGGEEV